MDRIYLDHNATTPASAEVIEAVAECLREEVAALIGAEPKEIIFVSGGAEGEIPLMNLDLKGVAVSTGSACSSGTLEPSHVLRAMGVGPEYERAALRFSLGKDNTEAEIDRVLELLSDIVPRARSLAPSRAVGSRQ